MQLMESCFPASSLPQGWSEQRSARLGCMEGHQVPVPIQGTVQFSCLMHLLAHDFPPFGFICAMLQDLGWESCRPTGTGDDYSHFLSLLTPRSCFHFLNPHPSIFFVAFFVVFFGGIIC